QAGDPDDRAAKTAAAAAQARTRLRVDGSRLTNGSEAPGSCATAQAPCIRRAQPPRTGCTEAPCIGLRRGGRSSAACRIGWVSRLGGWSYLDLGFANVDESPLAVLCEGIFIALAQEANVVGVLQLL